MATEPPPPTHVDATSFSCLTGRRKPDPLAYLTATRALGVDPRACLFVGDGGSGELTGAAMLGMRSMRYSPPGAEVVDVDDPDTAFAGPTLVDLFHLTAAVADSRG